MSKDAPAIVLDIGTGSCKAGMAGDDQPTVLMPPVVGRRLGGHDDGFEGRHVLIGEDALVPTEHIGLSNPIDKGIIRDWEDMRLLWHDMFFHKLGAAPESHPVLLSEAALTPRSSREKMAEIMFEQFHTPAIYISVQEALSLFASGRTTGLVVSSGYSTSHAVPVLQGCVVHHAIRRLEVGGRDLTDYLTRLLSINNIILGRADVRVLKETACFVAEEANMKEPPVDELFTLPDDRVITMGVQRVRCPEALFQPKHLGIDSPGIHTLAFNAVMRCDADVRERLLLNVVPAGGSTRFPGFDLRLKHELGQLGTERKLPCADVFDAPDRHLSSWQGGSLLASLSKFQNMWVSHSEYAEHGPRILRLKCF